MADELDDDRDEEWFKEVYGTEYIGPPRAAGAMRRGAEPALPKVVNKRAPNPSDSEEDDEPRDPNAVPTDFTSREAKVWEAKAKAVERNWKRRKEEELTCRLCGEVGHFAQGCPTTLGGNRKPGEIVERISLRDKRLKPRIIGTGGAIIQGIEKETGCRLKVEDNLTVGNGTFFVKITGPDRVAVKMAVTSVNKLVDQVEDEWKQQAGPRKLQGRDRERDRGGIYLGGNAALSSINAGQMQHIGVKRHQHDNNVLGGTVRRGDLITPPLDEEKRTIEHIASQLEARRHWETVSGSSQQSLNGSYKEGVGSLAPTLPGKVDGGSAYYPDCALSYPRQAEQELEMELEYDVQSLDELERRFLEETIEITKDQNKEEDKENSRHRETLREIQEQFQQKMTKLRAKQAKQREDFLRAEAHMRYQTPISNYSHYQYGGSGGSVQSASSCGRPTSNYLDPLPSRSVSAYSDPIPQYEGSYDSSYDKVYEQNPTEPLQAIRATSYDSYTEAPYSSGSTSYNRKQGYGKPGYDNSNVYNKSQVYDTKPYSYGTAAQYPAYG
ncbi:uncharacterized protein [Physcomitrium patens]|uniref:CCHC-type domain-containing protein n=1 Tax=Physcomitrium patens TaxID=3218 RepID=A0A7I4D172_PHYPA|nr:uncharacterized protein LOC112278775 isoform X2 [Physcomitrium patens]|eukprot:XP_024368290.1 uncharacterized protein LOC112278775 isoform X2 [Physcomitrella patens]